MKPAEYVCNKCGDRFARRRPNDACRDRTCDGTMEARFTRDDLVRVAHLSVRGRFVMEADALACANDLVDEMLREGEG